MSDGRDDSGPPGAPRVNRWQAAALLLGVVATALLIINFVLRARVDEAVEAKAEAVTAAERLTTDNADLAARNEQLLTQLSASNERLSELVTRLSLTKKQLSVADADVARQVAAQKAAQRAVSRADSQVQKARARQAAAEAQLRNAQTCSAAGIKALSQIHAGPDIESGAEQAAVTLESALPACRAAFE